MDALFSRQHSLPFDTHSHVPYAENGPFTLNEDLSLKDNPYGWDVSHNVIYVDQPIGTGYSYSDDPADTVHGEKGNPTLLRMQICP